MNKVYLALACTIGLASCAQKSNEISASYVSPIEYQNFTCSQIQQEAARISRRAASLSSSQDEQADEDAALTAVSLILFWPAAFFIDGDDEAATQLAELKGRMEAIEQINIQKNCGLVLGG